MKNYFRVLASILVLSFTMPVIAHNSDSFDKEGDRPSFGVRAFLDLTDSRTVSEITDWGVGGAAGISYYVYFGKLANFNPGILIGCETVKLDGYAGSEKRPFYFNGNIKTIGMRLPLDFGINVICLSNVKVSLYTGPHIFINFAVKGKYKKSTDKVTIPYDKTLDNYKCFELDWGVGLAVDIKRHWHVQVESNIGLNQFAEMEKVYPDEISKFKRIAFSLGLGYNF